FPISFEAAEVIEAHNVAGLYRPAQTIDPPLISPDLELAPVVERISPALPRGTERIGRNAGNDYRCQVVMEAKDVGMRPDISAVVADEDCDIADDSNTSFSAVRTQLAPLIEKRELQEA